LMNARVFRAGRFYCWCRFGSSFGHGRGTEFPELGMAAFRSCPEILFRPEGPEVSLCSLSRAAPSSPSPALAPGTSLPVRRGGRHGGGVAAVCVPGVPVGWLGCPRCPRPTAGSPAHRRNTDPGNESNSSPQTFPKKKKL
jgi:hypothetical protein